MLQADEFRQLLIADMALVMKVVEAHDVAAALMRYWDQRETAETTLADELIRIAKLDPDALVPVEAEVDRLIGDAGGNAQLALTRRGGLDRSIHVALSGTAPPVAVALTQVGAGARTPLPTVRPDRYIDFMPAGEGGMGLVYMALDTELNRMVAFKMVRPDGGSGAKGDTPTTPVNLVTPERDTPASRAFEELKARFLQEAWVTGGLEHPGIVPVYELGETQAGIPYYTMRFVRGQRTLKDALNEVRNAPVEDRLQLLEPFLKLCDTVRYAHAKGVIHRDLKPDNVALGEFGEVVLLDWGLAKLEGREDIAASRWQERVQEFREAGDLQTVAGALGTPGYMSPEAATGRIEQVDAKSDVYSLGVMLYEILTGQLPFQFTTYPQYLDSMMRKVAPRARASSEDVPADLDWLCATCLSRDRTERPEDVAALSKAVRNWQAASALEREVEGHLRDARGALETAEGASGDERLRQVERAAGALQQVQDKQGGHAALAELRARSHALRERGIREREKASGRRLLLRVGLAALVLVAIGGLVVAAVINAERAEKSRALEQVEEERDAKTEALGLAQAERDAKGRALEQVEQERNAKAAALSQAESERDAKGRALAQVRQERNAKADLLIQVGRERDAKARALDDVLRLADSRKVRDLEEEAAALSPLQPDLLTRTKSWAVRAAELFLRLPEHEAALERLTQRIQDEKPGVRYRGKAREEREALRWQHGMLEDLVARLNALPVSTANRRIERLRLQAEAVQHPAWAAAIERVAKNSRYDGLALRPQAGLVPLGPDPDSGLEEFAHVTSGEVPARDPKTKRLLQTDDFAIVLVLIPGGTFRMGDGHFIPVHEVTLAPYFIGKYECTQAQWATMTRGAHPAAFQKGADAPRRPVETVMYLDCARWLSEYGLGLPTESEWEHACRAGTDTPYWSGSTEKDLARVGWISGPPTHPVGEKPANAFGLHDTHGNVFEWVRDPLPLPTYGDANDPVDEKPGVRVCRGGGYNSTANSTSFARQSTYNFVSIPTSVVGVRPAKAVTSD